MTVVIGEIDASKWEVVAVFDEHGCRMFASALDAARLQRFPGKRSQRFQTPATHDRISNLHAGGEDAVDPTVRCQERASRELYVGFLARKGAREEHQQIFGRRL